MHHISLSGDMVMQGTFLTPTGVFLVSMTIMYLVTALLHPEEFGMVMLYNCKKKMYVVYNVCYIALIVYVTLFYVIFSSRDDCLRSDVFHLHPQWIPPADHLLTG